MSLKVALVGNPNVGKTSLYNRITGSFEHVGNWHGVTVGSAEKTVSFEGENVTVTDLPGMYSMSIYSHEEEISRDHILGLKSDVILGICEVGNIRRNLYLLLQILEFGAPLAVVINMVDELERRGGVLHSEFLSDRLGVPVIAVSAKRKTDAKRLMSAISCGRLSKRRTDALPYIGKLPIAKVRNIIRNNIGRVGLKEDWVCLKVLENDRYVTEKLELSESQRKQIAELGDWQSRIVALRYEYVDYLTNGLVENGKKKRAAIHGFSAIDKLILNKYLALPIFFLLMAGIFYLTFGLVGKFLSDMLALFIDGCISVPLGSLLGNSGAPQWMTALVCDGIINGVGSMMVFLPQIVLLFFFLALLEDSGYISRVAFMTDGLFRKIGLTGRSVFTMLMGFGCSATAVLTARGLEDENTRKKTVLLTPFMSCSARLPVYSAIAGAFFFGSRSLIIFALYLLGALVAVALAAIFEKRVKKLKSGQASFIMEMPPYRMPTAERLLQIILNNVKVFLIRVGTVIFALNVIIWVLSYFSFTKGYVPDGSGSIFQMIAGVIAPVFAPLGFGNWKAVTALLSGVVAKEIVITSISGLGGMGEIFTGEFASAAALSFMTFTLLYTPCAATLGAIKKEIGWKYALFSFGLQTAVAYVLSLIVYLIGVAFISLRPALWIIIVAIIGAALIFAIAQMILRRKKKTCMGGCAECEASTKGCNIKRIK